MEAGNACKVGGRVAALLTSLPHAHNAHSHHHALSTAAFAWYIDVNPTKVHQVTPVLLNQSDHA